MSALDVSGKIECVALEFSKGDGRVLQVVEQHLDLEGKSEGTLRFHAVRNSNIQHLSVSSLQVLSEGVK